MNKISHNDLFVTLSQKYYHHLIIHIEMFYQHMNKMVLTVEMLYIIQK